MKQATTALVAVGALLVGGIATAAFINNRDKGTEPAALAPPSAEAGLAVDDAASGDELRPGGLDYAEILAVEPVTEKEKVYATVIGSEPVRETTQTTVPREVCEDVVVQERLPERDGNVGGTVAGAVIGGVLGNQIGGGKGKKVATAAGAIAGGVIGNQVDKRHEGGRVVTRTERQCHTVSEVSESTRVTGYNVTYRNADGTTGTMRMASKPGERIAMGTQDKVVAWDVTYRYQGQEGRVRLAEKPDSDRLPVVDGKVVPAAAVVDAGSGSRQ
ncbi:glycine zipper 2TM domain-containing protein [Pseudoxanthomonas taiwanensis]|uniref:Glycine zipper 2TM domain-containing protein n=1 Tax=Pseudoxanthomonas taiwanensis TaxID=176598 RepID=A0A921P449_9GAMM|nr:glycine zipper 2TM domain-containing protein [Pseudoxanthomonas taiwanensis]KAF1689129.1 hypothetical protein CR938_07195 [Pseudoxanthomonas taiwanensis]